MKSISTVEYLVNRNLIRILEKILVEEAITKENTNCFSLAYSSPIFEKDIIEQIGSIGQSNTANNLIYNNIQISIDNGQINQFLPLLYQPNYKLIPTNISIKRWNNH